MPTIVLLLASPGDSLFLGASHNSLGEGIDDLGWKSHVWGGAAPGIRQERHHMTPMFASVGSILVSRQGFLVMFRQRFLF